jgi:hypothetical protein
MMKIMVRENTESLENQDALTTTNVNDHTLKIFLNFSPFP